MNKNGGHPRDTGHLAWREARLSFHWGPSYLHCVSLQLFSYGQLGATAATVAAIAAAAAAVCCLLNIAVTKPCDLVIPSIGLPEW